jgi:hypothetical protein
VEVADFNGDRIPDIVSGGYTTLKITVMLGRPDGSFKVAGQYPLRGVWPSQFQIADLNRDGSLDVATSSYAGGQITILLGNGDGTFRRAKPVPGTILALALEVSDFNGDRIPDMAVTESIPALGKLTLDGNTARNLLHGSVKILIGRGDGTFKKSNSYPIGVLSENIRYADVNEDGKGDLVILNALIGNDASILYGRGDGSFAPERRIHVGGPDSIEPLNIRTIDGSEGQQLVDFNRDGHLDMVVTQMISSTLVIFEGDGHGHFNLAGQQRVTGFPEGLMAGDLDSDHCPDLAVPGNVPPIGPADVGIARVSILLNRSAGCTGSATAKPTKPPVAAPPTVEPPVDPQPPESGGADEETPHQPDPEPILHVSVVEVVVPDWLSGLVGK